MSRRAHLTFLLGRAPPGLERSIPFHPVSVGLRKRRPAVGYRGAGRHHPRVGCGDARSAPAVCTRFPSPDPNDTRSSGMARRHLRGNSPSRHSYSVLSNPSVRTLQCVAQPFVSNAQQGLLDSIATGVWKPCRVTRPRSHFGRGSARHDRARRRGRRASGRCGHQGHPRDAMIHPNLTG